MLSKGPTHDARFCTICLYVYDELRTASSEIVSIPPCAYWLRAEKISCACKCPHLGGQQP